MTAPPEPEIVTPEELAAFQAEDGIDELSLAAAISEVRGYCGWHIAPQRTETLTLDGSGLSVLLLPTMQVASIAGVTESGVALDAAAYEWSEKGMLRKRSGWTDRWRGVEVTLAHGYDAAPAEIKRLILASAAAQIDDGAAGSAEKVGPFEFSVAQLQPHQLAILNRYRLGWGA
ncbi:hypothetical protein C8K38_111203 [Rhodococcus sp. OK611]|uniref:hypothetical protein n=1 Tax=unclassified Rhodococcus (in: high G+C Gram-positive bacteria) TaxID=192944 RepID=UPI000BC73780|nr:MULTISPECIES: hypothetical protein [unclassified Rhodococcus (in: high G+C Gram-positive bacteria)]PTR42034.1 hypothetical protein C8K38_111203 [Rhodococcus sp. OK611]SNX91519.1 hypothetical protein SAMN05447004_11054 [Rhodococcus sp. OK270]